MRLRTQLTLVATGVVALMVALAGLFLVVRVDHRDRAALDRTLAVRAEQVRIAAARNGSLPTDGSYVLRLIADGVLQRQVGSSAGFPLPAPDGYSTVEAGDDEWRSFSQTLVTGAQLQVLISLDDLAEQHTDNVLTVDLLVLLAALLSAAGVWFATGLVLRPFQRLLAAAREIDPADPGQRLPEVTSPQEVADLSAAMNDLLDRARAGRREPAAPAADATAAQAATPAEPVTPAPATRTPAAPEPVTPAPAAPEPVAPAEPTIEIPPPPEPVAPVPPAAVADPAADLRPRLADLGTNLDALLDHPDMPATQRHLLLAAMADEHRRMVELVDGLRRD